MSVQHKNLQKHYSKLRKSIDNKLFDLLIDLDDENSSDYPFKDINIILKYYIINKILYNKRCIELLKISDKNVHQELTIGKSNDNLIYITSILSKNRNEPELLKNSFILCNNNYDDKNIIKRYSCDLKPLINFINTYQSNRINALKYYCNDKLKFSDVSYCKDTRIYIPGKFYNNINMNINNYHDVEDHLEEEEPRNDQPAPKLVKISNINKLMDKGIDENMKKYINEKAEIEDYNKINIEDLSEKEQLKLAIELSKKEYLNKFIEDSPKVEIDQLTGSIVLTHKQRDRIKYYNKNNK